MILNVNKSTSSPPRWNWSMEQCTEWTDTLKTFLKTFTTKTWKGHERLPENFLGFWYKANMNSKTHSLGWKACRMLAFDGLIFDISWIIFHDINLITSWWIYHKTNLQSRLQRGQYLVVKLYLGPRLLGDRNHGFGTCCSNPHEK